MAYYFKPSALADLRRLPKSIQKRILQKLDFYVQSKNPIRFAKALADKEFGEYRFRIGEYRVIFDFEKGDCIILAIGNRKDIYR